MGYLYRKSLIHNTSYELKLIVASIFAGTLKKKYSGHYKLTNSIRGIINQKCAELSTT